MNKTKIFLSAVLAGCAIGFGGTVFLSVENKILGSLFFTVGLFVVCTMKLHLYTGKVCYVFQNDKAYLTSIPVIWLGNFVGTGLVAVMVRLSRIATIAERAMGICETKLGDGLLSIFILSVFCNIFIYIGVDGFNNNPHEAGKYISLFFGVMVFILCGFEHCVANMYYFSVAGAWSAKAFSYLLVMTLGNAAGGVSFPLARNYLNK